MEIETSKSADLYRGWDKSHLTICSKVFSFLFLLRLKLLQFQQIEDKPSQTVK